MPPREMTIPRGDEPTPLIPDDVPEDADDTFAGLPVIAAKKQTKDAFNVLLYAFPGVGKTSLAGMFAGYPPACDVLVVDAEGGASVLAHLDNVYVMQVTSWDQVEKVLSQLERTPLETLKYRTVVFDNLTELHAMLVQKICGNNAPEIQQHGIITAALMRFTRRVRDLSRKRQINTALIAWEDAKEDKGQGITRKVVALTDKLSARIPGVPNNVGYMTVMHNPPLFTRKLSFAVTPLNDAKFRRAPTGGEPEIPLDIYYGINQNPIADILRTIYEGVPFPKERYVLPTGRAKAQANNKPTNGTVATAEE